ncbi:MAG: asnB [Bacillales bacterium]|jgi:asparagine synthase (glutamine-hydrolysing)|nr:asnB [Bacillales bacterium]
MCGFIGCVHNKPFNNTNDDQEKFKFMNDIITHRGPDDDGFFTDDHIQFGFRRLSIIDLEAGHQPLTYENDRYVIIFNGEIYNYLELREMLISEGSEFRTQSDTEVIIALYASKKQKVVEYLRGMFAFLIWDKEEKVLFGARDHFGIKPLHYYEKNNTFYFASEKKSILEIMDKHYVNQESLQHYFTYQYVPEPLTMSMSIMKLEPGHYFIKKINEEIEITQFWKPEFKPVDVEKNILMEEIRNVLFDSVQIHMRSDVPVGSFLSGGIDSTIIASIANQFHPGIKTFSVGFKTEGYSEVDVAKETAEKIGVENHEVFVSAEEFVNELPKIIWHMDDPLADPAAVPLYFVAKEAAKHVTVVLSGEGSDELFGGYNIYHEPFSLKYFDYVPSSAKGALKTLSKILPDGFKGKSFIQRGSTPIEDRYFGNAKIFNETEKQRLIRLYNEELSYKEVTKPLYERIQNYDDVSKMQYIDMYTWLRGDILLKADKMTMAHSLELRVPFLDKEVFNIASKIPTNMKITNGTTKAILREAVRGIIPDHVLDRRKLGFPVPIRHWLKDELFDWAESLIHTSEVDYLLHKNYVLQLLNDHRLGKADYSRKIWTVLMFMLWHQIYIENIYDINELQNKNQRCKSIIS